MEKEIEVSVRTTDETGEETMEKTMQEKMQRKTVVNHFEAGANCQVFNGNITGCVFAMPGSTVAQNHDDRTHPESQEVTAEELGKAIACCGKYIWSPSALAVIFGICRDKYDWADNGSEFERRMAVMNLDCPSGTIANAMRNNPYLRMNYKKWASAGAKRRVMVLAEEFQKAIDKVKAT